MLVLIIHLNGSTKYQKYLYKIWNRNPYKGFYILEICFIDMRWDVLIDWSYILWLIKITCRSTYTKKIINWNILVISGVSTDIFCEIPILLGNLLCWHFHWTEQIWHFHFHLILWNGFNIMKWKHKINSVLNKIGLKHDNILSAWHHKF